MNDNSHLNEPDNPFGTTDRKRTLEDLMKKGLIKRITLIEGNYPTQKQQRDFLERIKEWLAGGNSIY